MLQTDTTRAGQWRELKRRIAADPGHRADLIAQEAKVIRRHVITTIDAARAGHIGGDLSVTDILATLYCGVLELDPADPRGTDRDRFILSKGHCAAALYSTLARVGYFSEAELPTFMKPGSALNGHPNRNKVPGVETNTGPLGTGCPSPWGKPSASGSRAAAGASSSSPATASSRRARTGRPSWPPVTSDCGTSP